MLIGEEISKEKHDLDFVFLRRKDNNLYFLLKLSYNRVTENNLKAGMLKPEVAYLLSSLVNITEKGI